MKLVISPTFSRVSKRLLKRNPKFADSIKETLELLEKDVFHQQLKTHKLKGKLEGSWAYSTAYDLRVVFKIIQLENTESILLLAVGTHNEVY